MASQMKAGVVVHARIPPKDCIHLLRVLDAAGINRRGLSFASCVTLALSSLLGIAIKGGIIEESDGFDYLEMMGPYAGGHNNRVKRETSNALYDRARLGISTPIPTQPPAAMVAPSMDMESAIAILRPLAARVNAGEQLTGDDLRMFTECMAIVYK